MCSWETFFSCHVRARCLQSVRRRPPVVPEQGKDAGDQRRCEDPGNPIGKPAWKKDISDLAAFGSEVLSQFPERATPAIECEHRALT